MRGDPGDQGAPRGARRVERPPRARHRQRDDELHPHEDGDRRDLRGRARGGAAARLRGGRSDGGRLGRGRGRQDGDPRDDRVRLARHARRRRVRGNHGHRARAHPRGATRWEWSSGWSARATLVDGAVDVRVQPALVDRHHPAGRGRGGVQRGDAPGRRDPGDHARRARARAVSRPRRPSWPTWSRSSARPAPASSRTIRRGAASRRLEPGELRSPYYLRIEVDDRAGRARTRSRSGWRRTASPWRGSSSIRPKAAPTLHVVTHEAPPARSTPRSPRSLRCRRRTGRRPASPSSRRESGL